MIYNLYCSEDRDYTHHSVINDKDKRTQTIKCILCGHTQEYVILGRRASVSKTIYEAWEKQEKEDREKKKNE